MKMFNKRKSMSIQTKGWLDGGKYYDDFLLTGLIVIVSFFFMLSLIRNVFHDYTVSCV